MISDDEIEETVVIEKLRFLESESIKYSYILLYILGGLILVMAIIFSLLDLSKNQVIQSYQSYQHVQQILRIVVFYGVILALTLNFLKSSTWQRWREPVSLTKNIIKICAILSSTGVFIIATTSGIYLEIIKLKLEGTNLWEIPVVGPDINFHMYFSLIQTMLIFVLIFAGFLVLDVIMDIIQKREIGKADFRPAVLLLALATVYTYNYYQVFIIDRIANLNVQIFVNGLIISFLYIIDGTIFLLLDRKGKKKGKGETNNSLKNTKNS